MSDLISIIQVGLVVSTKVKIPCIVEFYDGWGISGHNLTNVLKHSDDLKLYDNDRKNDIIPVLLVDGHSSSFDMDFLQYICDENNKRIVIFGVTYATSLRRLVDSTEQNVT